MSSYVCFSSPRAACTRVLAALAVSVFAAGCNDAGTFTGECTTDTQCPLPGTFCRQGLCACRSDEACDTGKFCNSQGQCQPREGCRASSDCAATEFCDLGSGACLARTACGTNVHCDPGSVCDPASKACVAGCRDTADCPLYASCDGGSETTLGRCVQGRCDTASFCAYGDRCVSGTCTPGNDADLCRSCNPGMDNCGSDQNFCLINPFYDPARPDPRQPPNFCGTSCDSANPSACPNGYRCGDVSLVTNQTCRNDAECGGMGRRCGISEGGTIGYCSCAVDADCDFGSVRACQGSCGGLGIVPCAMNSECLSGNCVRQCLGGSGPCTSDAECPAQDLCSQRGGIRACLTNGLPCQTNQDCMCVGGRCFNSGRSCRMSSDCRPLTCRNGGCFIGSSCAPIDGLSCADVRGAR
jgi:hypothetical protein